MTFLYFIINSILFSVFTLTVIFPRLCAPFALLEIINAIIYIYNIVFFLYIYNSCYYVPLLLLPLMGFTCPASLPTLRICIPVHCFFLCLVFTSVCPFFGFLLYLVSCSFDFFFPLSHLFVCFVFCLCVAFFTHISSFAFAFICLFDLFSISFFLSFSNFISFVSCFSFAFFVFVFSFL